MSRRNQIFLLLGMVVIGIGVFFMVKMNSASRTLPALVNPGFEDGLNGWQSGGQVDPDGYSGSGLTHGAGRVETTQVLGNLTRGWYTLRVWVRSSGEQKEAYIALRDCGGEEARATVPIVKADKWMQIVVSAKVSGRKCSLALVSEIEGEGWVSFDEAVFEPGQAALSVMGADISSLIKSEDMGGVYAYEDGTEAEALEILSAHGMNYARIRVWVNSPDGYHGKEQILAIARRLKEQNMKLLVDFHYSDSWADPGQQYKPEAWKDLDFAGLKEAVYDHTYDICSSLKEQGTPADMVQVGNEINHGMLWPDGKSDDWADLAALLKEGARAVKDSSPDTLVMLHIAEGGDNQQSRWWFDNVVEYEVPFDVIGISYYGYWHGSLADLQNNLNDIALRYEKDIIVVETAYLFTQENNDHFDNIIRFQTVRGYDPTPEGQAKMLADVMGVVRAVPNGRGLGIFYWDATWTAVMGNGWDPKHKSSGNGWENQALFDYENRALPALSLFGKP